MAVIKAINSKASLAKAINYVTKKEKTEEHLISGIDCVPKNAINEMKFTKEQWNKTEGRQYMHLTQSFKADEKITPEQAHKIAYNLFKNQYKGHEKLIVTHTDKEHIHSHIIVNSVNFENGYKLQQSKKDLQKLKDRSDQLCKEQGLTITQKQKEISTYDIGKYKAIENASKGEYKSYILKTALDVSKTKELAKSKDEFIELMNKQGYKVDWQDKHKYITFTDKDGHKVRNANIEKTFKIECGKEQLINEFTRNSEKTRGTEQQFKRNTKDIITRTEHKGENGIRKHIVKGEFRAISDTIRAVEQGINRANQENRGQDKQPTREQQSVEKSDERRNTETNRTSRERNIEHER